jgi:hypothetical protein
MFEQDPLTPVERELETALRSLRPTPARIDPMAAALAADRHTGSRQTGPKRRRVWQVTAAAAAVIIIVAGAWLTLVNRRSSPEFAERPIPMNAPDLALAINGPIEPPTLFVYRRALDRSPAELYALLDRQATTGSVPSDEFTRAGVLTLWSANLHPSLGEM